MMRDPNLSSKGALDAAAVQEILARGMSPRQQELDQRWRYYTGTQHDGKIYTWGSNRRMNTLEAEAMRQGGGRVFPGQYTPNSPAPKSERYPSTRYLLPRRITRRFTGMMFSQEHHPDISILDDEDTQAYMRNILKAASFWSRWEEARNYGGGQGSACLTYGFEEGKLVVEVHDPRWCFPEFKNRRTRDLKALEIRYVYSVDVRDTETGLHKQVWYWFRRVIDEVQDVTYKPARLTADPRPPVWEVDTAVRHRLGELPGVWVQNEKCDGVDGLPDCSTATCSIVDEMDEMLTEATTGVKKNIDPTVVLSGSKNIKELNKGSDNALHVGESGSATYLTLPSGAVEEGRKHWEMLRDLILETESCVLDLADVQNATATEIRKRYEAMSIRIGGFQTQYTEHGIIPLVQKILRSIRAVDGKVTEEEDDEGNVVKYKQRVFAPPNMTVDKEGNNVLVPVKIGKSDGALVSLTWPPLSTPSLEDIAKAASAAVATRPPGGDALIDKITLTRWLARFFGEENAQAVLSRLKAEAQEKADDEKAMMGGAPAGDGPPAEGAEGGDKALAGGAETDEYQEPNTEVMSIIERADHDPAKGTVTLNASDFVRLAMAVPQAITPQ